ncbi:MAG: DNA-binding transcriptional LysR family regulator [Halieaceae bacterium]
MVYLCFTKVIIYTKVLICLLGGSSNVEFRQLRHFLVVMQQGSMAKAAKQLGLSPQAVGQSITRLEEDLGVSLFDRRHKKVTATEYAPVLEAHAHQLLAQHRVAEEELRAMSQGSAGSISVAFSGPISGEVGPMALSECQSHFPKLKISLNGGHIDQLIPALRKGELDIVAGVAEPSHYVDPELEVEDLFPVPTVLAVRRSHPLAGRNDVSLEQLATYPWIVVNRGHKVPTPIPMLEQFYEAGVTPPTRLIHNSSTSAALGVLDKGDYIVMTVAYAVPLSVAGPYSSGCPFVWLNFACDVKPRMACMLKHTGVVLPRPALYFMACLRRTTAEFRLHKI